MRRAESFVVTATIPMSGYVDTLVISACNTLASALAMAQAYVNNGTYGKAVIYNSLGDCLNFERKKLQAEGVTLVEITRTISS